jgi:hypothetical protein
MRDLSAVVLLDVLGKGMRRSIVSGAALRVVQHW